jgi:hypothetical protein
MKFFATYVQFPETREFLEATDAQIAEWIRLHALCAKQVNGGRIEAAASLPDKFWHRHGINPATLFDPSPLWRIEAGDLVLEHFDHEGQRIFLSKSKGGKTRAEQKRLAADSRTPSSSPRNNPDRSDASPIPSRPVPTHPDPNESLALDTAPTTPPSKKRQQEMAEAIYQAYPKHEAKPPALAAIRKAMRSHNPEFLLERTRAYATAISWQERQYIPLPATWFNQERFNDDPENWKPPGQKKPAIFHRPINVGGRKPSGIMTFDEDEPEDEKPPATLKPGNSHHRPINVGGRKPSGIMTIDDD